MFLCYCVITVIIVTKVQYYFLLLFKGVEPFLPLILLIYCSDKFSIEFMLSWSMIKVNYNNYNDIIDDVIVWLYIWINYQWCHTNFDDWQMSVMSQIQSGSLIRILRYRNAQKLLHRYRLESCIDFFKSIWYIYLQ